ncbi:MAG: Fic family protein [Coprobacillus sp.]|nr:Fic family protein [Coprobacillus sp.]
MHKFDYSFLKDFPTNATLLNYLRTIYEVKGKESFYKEKYSSVIDKFSRIAVFESVKASNAIEGIYSTDTRIKKLIEFDVTPKGHDEAEIKGYQLVLDLIHSDHENLDFCEKDVLGFHSLLLSLVDEDARVRGCYKPYDNFISGFNKETNQRFVVWNPVSAIDTPVAMEQLYLAFMDARSDSSVNNLLLIPCVILDFLCIHPFLDGNGRMSRLITSLLLYQCDIDVQKYISFERVINENKNRYYDALQASSVGWHENNNDYTPFIIYFFEILRLCYQEFEEKFITLESSEGNKSKQVEDLIMSSSIPLSNAEVSSILIGVSKSTITAEIKKLLKEGKIIKIGTTKGATYIRNKEYKG